MVRAAKPAMKQNSCFLYLNVESSFMQKVVQRVLARFHNSLANVKRKLLKLQVEMIALSRLRIAKLLQSLPSTKNDKFLVIQIDTK